MPCLWKRVIKFFYLRSEKALKVSLLTEKKIEPGLEVELKKDTTLMIGNTVLSFQKESYAKTLAKPYSFAAQTKPFDISESSDDSSRNYIQSLELLLKVSNIFAQSLNIQELLGLVIDQILTLLKKN